MKRPWIGLGVLVEVALAAALPLLGQQVQVSRPLVGQVDPLIGVEGRGSVVPGAGLPFGFVRLSPERSMPTTIFASLRWRNLWVEWATIESAWYVPGTG